MTNPLPTFNEHPSTNKRISLSAQSFVTSIYLLEDTFFQSQANTVKVLPSIDWMNTLSELSGE